MHAGRPHMPGYGIVPGDEGEGLLPLEWAEARLRDARNYWVATVGRDGRPHLMAVWGVWLDRRFLFSTARRSRKARNLGFRSYCVIAPEGAAESVVVEGTAKEVGFEDAFVAAYRAKYDFDPTTLSEPVFAVKPQRVFGFIDADDRFTQTATRWIFDD